MGSAVVRARACSFAWHVSLVGGGTLQVKGARVSRNALIASLCLPNSTSHLSLSQTQTNTVDNHMLVLCLLLNHLPWMTPVSLDLRARDLEGPTRQGCIQGQLGAVRPALYANGSCIFDPEPGPRASGRAAFRRSRRRERETGITFCLGGCSVNAHDHVEKCKDTLSL